jgi:hypothetical protein
MREVRPRSVRRSATKTGRPQRAYQQTGHYGSSKGPWRFAVRWQRGRSQKALSVKRVRAQS